MGTDVVALTNEHPEFYRLIGPFLSRREIERETGGRLYDEDGKTWFAAISDGNVVGVCAAVPGAVTIYQSDYVLPAHRGRGAYRALSAARAAAFPGRARAVCTAASLAAYLAGGFRETRRKGRFTVVEREPTGKEPVMPPEPPPTDTAPSGDPFGWLDELPEDQRIDEINDIRRRLAQHSPMRGEPVDCVLWLRQEQVHANAYNPNVVAPAEMRLLTLSVLEDGYTQPVVAWPDGEGSYEIVDGFHRNRVAREAKAVRKRVHGRLPVAVINPDRAATGDRMAATIRHNRARGVHTVDGMSAIVIDLARRNHSDKWIGEQLGMEPDEVLRLKQVQAMAEMFADREFSEAWEAC
ncbi:MAG TPA: ParB/RepB/Spo0J family partition protein [Streptosporangiaceae bacterium]|nr:ParB/RepB/Spo0J family partition protein [Streptosporangiaceae bacterium]